MSDVDPFVSEHKRLARRFFMRMVAGGAAVAALPRHSRSDELPPQCAEACEAFLKQMDYLTPPEEFRDVSRGNPRPYNLSDEQKQAVGLTRESWQLEVVSDPDHPADVERPLTKESGTALTWDQLMKLAEKHVVSIPKVMTCNNIGRPLGMGFWEGIPLREVLWMTRPKQNLRRIFYSGYHNDDPKQLFRSSLPIGRALEDPPGLPPVILCYKLNGRLLGGERGAPVRMLVPEAYGFKSVKWLNRIVLSNLPHANDTYAEANNDIDSWMKTFAHSLLQPDEIQAGQPIPLTGYAQVGISGLKRVQTAITPKDQQWPEDDPYFTKAQWNDAHILPPPQLWGGNLPGNRLPPNLYGFEPATGQPKSWPMRLTMAHWATVLPALPAGEYTLRCRSIDVNGYAQPMPRPFRKSGRSAIEAVPIVVSA